LKDNKVNWTGFYFIEPDGGLVVGPYQGKLACQRIPKGKGVCGMAVSQRECMLINDVHQCEDHIACDSNSKSEIVFPIMVNQRVVGVLDIDSLVVSGFNEADKIGLLPIVDLLEKKCQWQHLITASQPSFSYFLFIPIAITVIIGAISFVPGLLFKKKIIILYQSNSYTFIYEETVLSDRPCNPSISSLIL